MNVPVVELLDQVITVTIEFKSSLNILFLFFFQRKQYPDHFRIILSTGRNVVTL